MVEIDSIGQLVHLHVLSGYSCQGEGAILPICIMKGMTFLPAGEHLRMELVVDGGPAAEAGLQVGNLITLIDGPLVTDFGCF